MMSADGTGQGLWAPRPVAGTAGPGGGTAPAPISRIRASSQSSQARQGPKPCAYQRRRFSLRVSEIGRMSG